MKKLRTLAAIAALAGACATAQAQIPDGYYDSLKGKKGAALKTAVHDIIQKADVLNYGSGNGATWWGFWLTDRTDDGRFIDRYSPESDWVQSTSQGATGSGMNIEHSFPKSWWGGAKNQAYCDLYNLMPCESKTNSSKSNYPMGKTSSTTFDNGATKIGTGDWGVKVWEPADEWKGDFARGYMYMATCYQTLSWTSAGVDILSNGDYPTLLSKASSLYIQWAKADKPSAVEITRNNAVSKIQGNRNPYVDFPNLMEYVWGDSVDYAFDPATTVHAEAYSGGDTPTPTEDEIASYVFTEGDCGFTTETAACEDGKSIWNINTKYGWVGSSYFNNAMTVGDATLVSPEIDLTGCSSASFSFEHAANKMNGAEPSAKFSVEIRCEGSTATVESGNITWPKGTVWTYNNSGDVSLNAYAGKKIQIAFHYTGDTESAGTWEIKNLYVKGTKSATSISKPATADRNAVTFYTIDGRQLQGIAGYNGVVVVKCGGKTWKVAK